MSYNIVVLYNQENYNIVQHSCQYCSSPDNQENYILYNIHVNIVVLYNYRELQYCINIHTICSTPDNQVRTTYCTTCHSICSSLDYQVYNIV